MRHRRSDPRDLGHHHSWGRPAGGKPPTQGDSLVGRGTGRRADRCRDRLAPASGRLGARLRASEVLHRGHPRPLSYHRYVAPETTARHAVTAARPAASSVPAGSHRVNTCDGVPAGDSHRGARTPPRAPFRHAAGAVLSSGRPASAAGTTRARCLPVQRVSNGRQPIAEAIRSPSTSAPAPDRGCRSPRMASANAGGWPPFSPRSTPCQPGWSAARQARRDSAPEPGPPDCGRISPASNRGSTPPIS